MCRGLCEVVDGDSEVFQLVLNRILLELLHSSFKLAFDRVPFDFPSSLFRGSAHSDELNGGKDKVWMAKTFKNSV